MKYRKPIVFLLTLLVLSASFLAYKAYMIWKEEINIEVIYPGIKVAGIDLGNLSKKEALDLIKDEKEEDKKSTMLLYTDDNQYNMKLEEIGYDYQYNKAIDEVYKIGKSGGPISRYKTIKDLRASPRDFELKYIYSEELLEEVLEKIGNNLYKPAEDASVSLVAGEFIVEEEKSGHKLAKEELKDKIKANIEELKELEMPLEIVEAKYRSDHYSRLNGVIGQYTTRYENSSQGRKKNIQISGNSVNNIVIHPGESLSYNGLTGPRTRSNGYVEAPIILNNEYVPGVGGGVCQTSTTLYNALLLSDLTIVERYNHTISPPYIAKGMDAVVTDGPLDLKFRNDFDFPVYISTISTNSYQTISIYGDQTVKDYQVRISTELVETIAAKTETINDPNLPEGERRLETPGRNGYRTVTYKSRIRNGTVMDSKQISQDYYHPANFVYRVGTGPRLEVEKIDDDKGEEALEDNDEKE